MALFDNAAAKYDNWCKTELGNYVDTIEKSLMKDVANPTKGEKALDLGCGTGIYSYWLLEQELTVIGIDISSEMLKVARSKGNSEKIEFVQGDIQKLPFPDETFDLVISNIVLEFTDNPKQIVSEALRVVKKGGRFVCGFIGKESSWGKMYLEKGKHDPTSVFAKAAFFSYEDISNLASIPPTEIKYGLYVGMNEFEDQKQAYLLEGERSKMFLRDEAGYIVVNWNKE